MFPAEAYGSENDRDHPQTPKPDKYPPPEWETENWHPLREKSVAREPRFHFAPAAAEWTRNVLPPGPLCQDPVQGECPLYFPKHSVLFPRQANRSDFRRCGKKYCRSPHPPFGSQRSRTADQSAWGKTSAHPRGW